MATPARIYGNTFLSVPATCSPEKETRSFCVGSGESIDTAEALRIKSSTYFSICSFSILVPPVTATIRPSTTYSTATFTPNMLISSTRLPRSTIGDEIRNENVTPIGRPALVKPMNRGMDEHEQNGVTVPSSAAMQFAQIPWNLPIIFLLFSGGK